MGKRRAHEGRLRTSNDNYGAQKWSAMDDFVLEQLVGKVSYRDIAIRLGRSPQAVQRRASYKGLSARKNWKQDKATRRQQLDKLQARNLTMTEEELSPYL